jgi:hypothetical protein
MKTNPISRRSIVSLFSTAAVALSVPAIAKAVVPAAAASPSLAGAPTVADVLNLPTLEPAPALAPSAPALVPMFNTLETAEQAIERAKVVWGNDAAMRLDFHLSHLLPVSMRTMRSVDFREFKLMNREHEVPALEVELDYWPSKFKIYGITLHYGDHLLFTSKKPAKWAESDWRYDRKLGTSITAAGDAT